MIATLDYSGAAEFDADFVAGRWQLLAADGTDGGGSGGGGTDSGRIALSVHWPGPITAASVDDPRVLMISVDAAGLDENVPWQIGVLTAPGAGENLEWQIEHVGNLGNLQVSGVISGDQTLATTYIEPFTEFVAGDMLAVSITAASAGCAATDLVVGFVLGEVAPEV